jgi:hypothetical protein
LCSQNKYFGIFSIGKGNPFYSGTYNYSSNKCVTATNESKLRIYERPYQGLNNWYQLPYYPNLTANTITILRIHRYNARFILGLDINAISNETNLIKNTAELMNITLSPNPVSSLLHVHLNTIIKESGAVTIKIIDQNDKEIWKSVNPQNDLVIDVHAFAQGVYFIQFMSQQGVVTKKFIVNR